MAQGKKTQAQEKSEKNQFVLGRAAMALSPMPDAAARQMR